jgi:hypothetical protein
MTTMSIPSATRASLREVWDSVEAEEGSGELRQRMKDLRKKYRM